MPRCMISLRLGCRKSLFAEGIPSTYAKLNFSLEKHASGLRFEFLEFSEKILATSYLATVVESDEIGFS